jgi:glycine betaine transporter
VFFVIILEKNQTAFMQMSNIKLPVFLGPFLLLSASSLYSFLQADQFLQAVKAANAWILDHFSWLFSGSTFFFFLLCIWTWFSPLAKVKIGGPSAQPLLKRWEWFSVTLCTTIAIGILFWASSEPLYHLQAPPKGLGLQPHSAASAQFAMSTLFMHWTFTPYSMYTVAGLVFALAYYNFRQPFSLGALFFPLTRRKTSAGFSAFVDAVCLYSLVAGMAATLGAGILSVAGGLKRFFGLQDSPELWGLIALLIVGAFVVSAITGLFNGIKILSKLNTYIFIGLALFVLVLGPKLYLLQLGANSLLEYVQTFPQRSLGIGMDAEWGNSWTVFYWANWLAWAPVTALFLGRVAQGYTVRDFILFNLIWPSLFSLLWMLIFGGNALYLEMQQKVGLLSGVLQKQGPEDVIYSLLDQFHWGQVSGLVFLFTAFLSYVAGADANTSAMSALCTKGISPESPEAPVWIKIAWGVLVGAVAWIMISSAGVDGIKMASNLGGFPALFLVIAVAFGLVRLLLNPKILE